MAALLLSTKLHIPRTRLHGVSRSRLTERLLAGVKHAGSFALLSGPAGFGKTTLLSQFAAELGSPIAWLSLDEADNDPSRFWIYLLAACRSVEPGIGESGMALLQTLPSLPVETIPTILINDLVGLENDLVLVLDDYHTIQNQAIHSALAFLLDHLPDKLHLIISTRVDPPWALARFRARDQLVEIRAADLRFTADETAAFLNEVMGLDLSPENLAALDVRTEGWVASLQLAALSMKGRSDVTRFIEAFTGSHVYVAEYLLEEVLGRQPEEVQSFLMQTSILRRLNAGLCEAVTGQADSQSLLKELYQANLFVIPLDDEGQWYRYHQLFMDLLRARLQQTLSKDAIAALHQRTAAWYEQAGMLTEAVEHAVLASNYLYAARLVEKAAMPMILNAYFRTVEDWLQMIPPEYLNDSLRANMAFAWMYLIRGNFGQAVPYLQRLQTLFSAAIDESDASLRGEWLALQSMVLGMQGKAIESTELAEKALQILPAQEVQVRTMTYLGLANMYEQMLDYERAAGAIEAIIQHARTGGDLASEILGISLLGRMVLQQGGLQAVYEMTSQALQRIERTGLFSPFSATLYGELAQVHYYWHQLAEARGHFRRSVELSVLGGFSDAEIYHGVFLSRLCQMDGDLSGSVQEIEKALERMQTAAPTFVKEEVIAQQVSIFLAVGRLAEAQKALQAYGFEFDDGFSPPALAQEASLSHAAALLYNSALRILLYRAGTRHMPQDWKHGVELADLVSAASLRGRHLPVVLQTLLLRAQLQIVHGDERAGLADIVRALELAQPERFISIFVEEGRPIAKALNDLLRRHRLGAVQPDYIQEILAAFPKLPDGTDELSAGLAGSAATEDEAFSLIELLTPRELEVLQQIAAGHSNQKIAEKLVITLSAVKKHTGNIFRKLNVSSRTQAVLRARRLGLLGSDG